MCSLHEARKKGSVLFSGDIICFYPLISAPILIIPALGFRWFILSDKCLYYFEFTTDKEPRGIIPLENVSVRDATDNNRSSRAHCFELFATAGNCIKACKTDSDGKVVEGKLGQKLINGFLNILPTRTNRRPTTTISKLELQV